MFANSWDSKMPTSSQRLVRGCHESGRVCARHRHLYDSGLRPTEETSPLFTLATIPANLTPSDLWEGLSTEINKVERTTKCCWKVQPSPRVIINAALNATIFDKDGFFRAGDAGYIKNGGISYQAARTSIKLRTANTSLREWLRPPLLVDNYIDQVAVVADERKFVSAGVVPEFRVVEYAHGIEFNSREDLCANRQIHQMMLDRIPYARAAASLRANQKAHNAHSPSFSMENGELTNTLKLRRLASS